MSAYKLRMHEQSKTTFVALTDYKQTVSYQHKLSKDTAVNTDFFRVGLTKRRVMRLEECATPCGVSRTETVGWDTPVLFGQKDKYYANKITDLLESAASAVFIATKMAELRVGIEPDVEAWLASASDDLSTEIAALLITAKANREALNVTP